MYIQLSDLIEYVLYKTQNMLQVLYSHGRLTHCGLGEDIAKIFTCRQPHLVTVSRLVTKSTRRQCCFVTAETVTLSVPIMLSCIFVICVSSLTTHSLCSVSEQTLHESTVGTLSSTAENTTAEVFQPKGTVTQHDEQLIAWLKKKHCILFFWSWEHSEMS